jgi:hypothetical protein
VASGGGQARWQNFDAGGAAALTAGFHRPQRANPGLQLASGQLGLGRPNPTALWQWHREQKRVRNACLQFGREPRLC